MYCKAVWIENEEEMEGTVPENWIMGKKLYWPNGINVKKAFKERHDPEEEWYIFNLVKIKVTSGKILIYFTFKAY